MNAVGYGHMGHSLPLGERGMVTVLFEDGGRYVFAARSPSNCAIQTIVTPKTQKKLRHCLAGQMGIPFGPTNVAEVVKLHDPVFVDDDCVASERVAG